MTDLDHRVAMAMHAFTGALGELHQLADDPKTKDLMRREFNDLTDAFKSFGRLYSKVNRQRYMEAAE